MNPHQLARTLGLEPLPEEGGLFRRTHLDAHSSAIYFLLISPEFSALHALAATETYHWYAGAPLRLLLPAPGGSVDEPVLGPDVAAGQRPQLEDGGGMDARRHHDGPAVRLEALPPGRLGRPGRALPGRRAPALSHPSDEWDFGTNLWDESPTRSGPPAGA